MRLLHVADIHYALKQFDWIASVAGDFDAICIAGDLIEDPGHVPPAAQIVVIRKYLATIAQRTRVLVCSGNHDLTGPDANGENVAHWIPPLAQIDVVPDGDCTRIGDTLFSVLPWWDGRRMRNRIATQLAEDRRKRDGKWIWLHHAPPANVKTAWNGTRYYGDGNLVDWIDRYRPDAVLSGHVHQAPFAEGGSWVDRIDETWLFNMGQQPGDAPACIVYDTDANEAVWFSIAGVQTVSMSGNGQMRDGAPDWLTAARPQT